MELPKIQQYDIDNLGQSASTTGRNSSSASSTTINLTAQETPQIKIDDFDKAVMKTLGLDPNNPEDVAKWNNMPTAEKTTVIEQYQKSKESTPEKNSVNLPEDWDQLSIYQKQKYIKNSIGEVVEKDWKNKTRDEQSTIYNKTIAKLIEETDPQYKKYNETDKKEAVNRFKDTLAYIFDQFKSNESITPEKITNALKDFYSKPLKEQNAALKGFKLKQEEQFAQFKEQFGQFNDGLKEFYPDKKISEITTQEKIDYVKYLQEEDPLIIDITSKKLNDLEHRLKYENELQAFYDKDLKNISDAEEIKFLQNKINKTNDNAIKKQLRGYLELLESKKGIEAYYNTSIKALTEEQINEYLEAKAKTSGLSSVEENAMDRIHASSSKTYDVKTADEIITEGKQEQKAARQALGRYFKEHGIQNRDVTANHIVQAINNMKKLGTKIPKGCALGRICAQAQLQIEAGQGSEPPKFHKEGEETHIQDFLGEECTFDSDGNISMNASNCELFRKNLDKFKNSEEFIDWYSRLTREDQLLVNSILTDKRTNISPELATQLGLDKLGFDVQVAALANKQEGIETNTFLADSAMKHSNKKDNKFYLRKAAQLYNADELGHLGSVLDTLEDKDFVDLFKNLISKRDDYNEIIEHMNTYKEAASAGNSKGASKSDSASASSSKGSSYSKETNPISYTEPEVKQQVTQSAVPSVQNIQESIEQLNLDSETDKQKLVDVLAQDSSVLGKLDPQKREAVLKVYCKQADGARLFELFKKNPSESLCSILLHYSFAKISVYKDEMFKILVRKSENNMEKYAKDLDINLETFADHHREYATKIAVKTKNNDLAQKIVDNHAFYGLQKGSSEHFELIRIINSKKKVENGAPVQSNFSNETDPPKYLFKA